MFRWWRTIFLFVVVVCLCFDSDFSSSSAKTLSPQGYRQALLGDNSALSLFSNGALNSQQQYWITLCAQLSKPECQYWLGRNASNKKQQLDWLLNAAKAGHVASQLAYGLASNDMAQGNKWLHLAASSGDPDAVISYYQFLEQHDVADASEWRFEAAKVDNSIALQLADNLWQKQQITKTRQVLQMAQRNGSQEASHQAQAIARFVDADSPDYESKSCVMQLQFVADSLAAMVKIDSLMTRFSQDPRLTKLPICLNSPAYIDKQELACQASPRLSCDLPELIRLAENVEFTHLVVVSQEGKANVNNGIMFLDLQDDYNVFVHELAHFAGFVDEYPLSQGMAKLHCSSEATANLIFAQSMPSASELNRLTANWGKLSNDFSAQQVSPARTCENTTLQAFKPVKQATFMEYHELANIPDIYLAIWLRQLSQPQALTPVYVNFAQYFEHNKQAQRAQYWWQKYHQYGQAQKQLQ